MIVCRPYLIPFKNKPGTQWGVWSGQPLEQGMTVKVIAQDGRWKITTIAHVVKWIQEPGRHYGIVSSTFSPWQLPEAEHGGVTP